MNKLNKFLLVFLAAEIVIAAILVVVVHHLNGRWL